MSEVGEYFGRTLQLHGSSTVMQLQLYGLFVVIVIGVPVSRVDKCFFISVVTARVQRSSAGYPLHTRIKSTFQSIRLRAHEKSAVENKLSVSLLKLTL